MLRLTRLLCEGGAMLRDLQSDLTGNVLEIVPVDWPNVHRLAEGLSVRFAVANGHRLIDILHVATALHFGVQEFLTFDANQKKTRSTGRNEGATMLRKLHY